MLAPELLDLLVCPKSTQPLVYFPKGESGTAAGFLVCPASRLRYRIEDDVPVMLVEEAESLSHPQVEALLARARELGLRVPT